MRFAWCFPVALVAVFAGTAAAQDGSFSSSRTSQGLVVGFFRSMFENVNESDARAATKVWIEAIVERRGIDSQVEVVVHDERSRLVSDLRSGSVDLVVIPSSILLQIEQEGLVEPWFVSSRSDSPTESMLLLVNRRSGIRNLSELRGRTVLVERSHRAMLADTWIDTELWRRGEDASPGFFREIRHVSTVSQAALPVFFGQADACIVSRASFETVAELNPQIGRATEILLESGPFVPDVVCLRSTYQSDFKDELFDGLARLHEDPKGQQILTVFRVGGLVRFREAYLDETRALLSEHAALASAREKVKTSTPQQRRATFPGGAPEGIANARPDR